MQYHGTVLHSWQSPYSLFPEKSSVWFLRMGFFVFLGVLYGIYFDNLFFSVALIVFAGAFFLSRKKTATDFPCVITSLGFYKREHFFSFSSFTSFSLVIHSEFTLLCFSGKPSLSVYISSEEIENIQEVLSKYLPETPLKEPVSHKILRFLQW
jgi:hypothetical protein